MKRKKIIALIILAVMSLLMVGTLFGCKLADEDRKFYTDYFFCLYNEDYTEVTILELTDLGKQQEILVIPKTINGVPVTTLGGWTKQWGPHPGYVVGSDKLKKIYIYGDYFNYAEKMSVKDIIAIQPLNIKPYCYFAFEDTKANIYFPYAYLISDFYKNLSSANQYDNDRLLVASISFYVNDELFFADSFSEDGLYILPENPYKNGYKFLGWFDENDVQWSGEYPQAPEEQLSLYAKWMEE